MKQKWIAILLLLNLLLALTLPVCATGETDPSHNDIMDLPGVDGFSVPTKAALLVELNSNTVLYALDATERNYPASLTKIMTCMLAIENGNMEDMVTVSENALANLHAAGSTAELQVGEEMSLRNLLYCLMISSGNDAANVIAEHIGGSIPEFVDMMNSRAAELGCTRTNFANPHGLHDENHYTTAQDLYRIVTEAMKYPLFLEITNTPDYVVPATNLSEERTLRTTNMLISTAGNNSWKYSKAAGIKTGFTTPAGRCLISTAEDGDMKLLGIIMGAETAQDALGDYSVQRSFPECINMFEYGFHTFSFSTVLTTLYPIAEIQVNQSAGSQTVALAPTEPIRTLVEAGVEQKDLDLDIRLVADSVTAPVEAGEILGEVTVSYNGRILGTCPLGAITSVARSEITHQVEEVKTSVANNWWKWLLFIPLGLAALLIIVIILLQVYRRRQRRRKVAARRRALELKRRKEALGSSWYDMEE